jgi:hypothetical protein
MRNSTSGRTPAGIVLGLICAALFVGGAWVLVGDVGAGRWFGVIVTLVAMVFFAVGAIGGLLGAERLPENSIAELVGWPTVERVLNRPLRDWFTPRRSRS